MSVNLNESTNEKIQKVLSREGYGSRREIETWLKLGRIHVNGNLAKLGDRITLTDFIELDKKKLRLKTGVIVTPKVLLYYKPEGEVCSRRDPQGRRTVFDKLPRLQESRWVMVGRLDINTSGLLLFTTDGTLANFLMHPRHEVEREYAIRVLGGLSREQMALLTKGVQLEDGAAKFLKITEQAGEGVNRWYHAILNEGRNREIRRMFEALGMQVSRLIRIRYGPVMLPINLSRGKAIELQTDEVKTLLEKLYSH